MRLVLATLVAFGLLTSSAAAQATATATPNKAGKGTKLHTELDASQPPVSGRIPRETVLSIQSGYRFDGRAVAKRCTAEQAETDACPAKSAVGTATVQADYNGFPVTVPIRLFLSRPQTGDVAGFFAVAKILGSTYSAPGRVVRSVETPFGLSVILATPAGDSISMTQGVTFKSFTSDIGATRTVTKGKKSNKRKVRHSLITNPTTCPGTWASRAAFTFGDGSMAALDAPIACVS